jgi:hypothetical protein
LKYPLKQSISSPSSQSVIQRNASYHVITLKVRLKKYLENRFKNVHDDLRECVVYSLNRKVLFCCFDSTTYSFKLSVFQIIQINITQALNAIRIFIENSSVMIIWITKRVWIINVINIYYQYMILIL